MKKYDMETLANLISSELQRMNAIYKYCVNNGHIKEAKFWQKQIKDLEQLDSVIWQELK